MTQCIQPAPFLRRRNRRQDKRQRQLEKLKRWRQRKAEIRQERIAAGLLEREPKMERWHRFEIGIRNKATGETCFVDLKSGRQAHKIAGLILKYL
jgi:hypothetical protein